MKDLTKKVSKYERAVQISLTDEYIISTKLHIEREAARRSYLFSVVQEAFLDRRKYEYRHPINWWEALKAALGMRAKYKVISFQILYPRFKPLIENYMVQTREKVASLKGDRKNG